MLTTYTIDKYLDKLFDTYTTNSWDYNYSTNQYFQTETENEINIEITATGISKNDLKIEVTDNVLTVEGKPTKSKFVSGFRKSWSLNEYVDVNSITAKLENGVLTLTLPKIKPVKKTVSISIS